MMDALTPNDNSRRIEITPARINEDGTLIFSDSALTQLFQSYIHLINSERQVIWQRYAAMIVANSFLLGLIQVGHAVGGMVAAMGLAISIFWLMMTIRGWQHFFKLHQSAQRFQWYPNLEVNPTSIDLAWSTVWWKDVVYLSAVATIVVFALGYFGLLVNSLFLW